MSSPIQRATEGDVDLLVQLIGAFYAESAYPLDEAGARRAFTQLATQPALGRVWLVMAEDEPVGYLALTFGFSLEYNGRDAFIDDFYIRPAHRDRGLGTAVLDEVLKEARSLDVRAVHLEVERTNQRAQAVYARHGFRDNDRQLLTLRLHYPE